MRDFLALLAGKLTFAISYIFSIGAGGTWPGEIALRISPGILKGLARQFEHGVILVAGTNGKTTTSLMIKTILETHGEKVVHNETGANLLNGVTSALLKHANWIGHINADWGVFEVDENSLHIVMRYVKPEIVVILNLFRDQLDRYGEVDVISEKWQGVLKDLPESSLLVLNSDDPQVAFIGTDIKANVTYFGLNDTSVATEKKEHATDSLFCPRCGARLTYTLVYYSHIGHWRCSQCSLKRPQPEKLDVLSPLPGVYNLYNTLAAVNVARTLTVPTTTIEHALTHFMPAFGRQEEFDIDGKFVKLFLSKNPVGFNQSLKTVIELGADTLLLVLNDQIPDGRDVSWIWDVDVEEIPKQVEVIVSGDRTYDMALRIKYADLGKFSIQTDLAKAIEMGLTKTKKGKNFYILPTYSAMLATRKLLTGRKIL